MQDAYRYLIHEKGIQVGASNRTQTFAPGLSYVPFMDKLTKYYRRLPTWQEPRGWTRQGPSEEFWAKLKMFPVSVWGSEGDDIDNPEGAGWFQVAGVFVGVWSTIYNEYQVEMLVPCKEQILNTWWNEKVECWPLGQLRLQPAEPVEAPPGVENMDGVWRIPAEEEQDAANDSDFYHSDGEDSYTYTTASEPPNWS